MLCSRLVGVRTEYSLSMFTSAVPFAISIPWICSVDMEVMVTLAHVHVTRFDLARRDLGDGVGRVVLTHELSRKGSSKESSR